MKACLAAVLSVAFCAFPVAAAERWRMQYFYEAPETEFVITGLAFPTSGRGMAAGYLSGKKDKPYAVSTSDGGETWKPVTVPDEALSLFFLDEKDGWLVGRDNLWRTGDFGQTWVKLGKAAGALRVWFVTPQRGWAVGAKKSVYETSDGGANWQRVAAAAEPKTTEDYTVYGAIAFSNPQRGIISGWSRPPRRGERPNAPEWIEPENARREWPGVTINLETQDAGAHWKVSQTSMFGQITALSFAPDGTGLGLVEFFDKFDFPSEVYRMEARTGQNTRVFRARDRVVTDVLLDASATGYLAAFEPAGLVFRSPVPGKLKILKSTDLNHWQETEVDYRALARRAVLASAGAGRVWVATDTGMILTLASE
ncbi:MAG TPA: hypothetical protein VHA11_07415 [Bryobacteraceae bacterium]|nr:hypothetical protein [Bryobacteraceae bacterium]